MNGFFKWINPRAGRTLAISDSAIRRYLRCVEEYNSNAWDSDWLFSEEGQGCFEFIRWFEENHR